MQQKCLYRLQLVHFVLRSPIVLLIFMSDIQLLLSHLPLAFFSAFLCNQGTFMIEDVKFDKKSTNPKVGEKLSEKLHHIAPLACLSKRKATENSNYLWEIRVWGGKYSPSQSCLIAIPHRNTAWPCLGGERKLQEEVYRNTTYVKHQTAKGEEEQEYH